MYICVRYGRQRTARTKGGNVKAFYRVAEVMEILNMGRTKVYDLIRAGVIPSAEIDGNLRVPVERFHEWLNLLIASRRSGMPQPLAIGPEPATGSGAQFARIQKKPKSSVRGGEKRSQFRRIKAEPTEPLALGA
jgi:excisionase family DNA binding protein